MRIGILSDTHDRLERTYTAVQLLCEAGAEALIHCGDLTGPAIVKACTILPCYFVLGNNDIDTHALRHAMDVGGATYLGWSGEVTLAGKHIAVTHGHLPTDVRRLLAARPDYFLLGHSHIAMDQRDGPTRRINPGALHRASPHTAAVLDLTTDELRFLTVPGK